MDVVIPLARNVRRNHWELRYLLRSLVKNFPNLGKIWLVGSKPEWVTNTEFIFAEDPLPMNKDGNIINKILKVCKEKELSNPFLRCSDDQLFLKPFSESYSNYFDLTPFPTFPPSKWYKRLAATQQYCRNHNWKSYNFDCHIPTIVDKEKFLEYMSDGNLQKGLGMTINTLFFNRYYSKTENKIPANLLTKGIRADFTHTVNDIPTIDNEISSNWVLSYSDYGMVPHFVKSVEILFPEKSHFEL